MNLFELSIPQFKKVLQSIERWLELAALHAERKGFDPNVLLLSRLAPDQWALARQIGTACDTAKFTIARLCAKEAPRHSDDQTTLAEVRARIQSVVAYLDAFKREDFTGAGERLIAPPTLQGRQILGNDYYFQMQLPNFYFHATTAYAILRHNGVELGKADFLGPLPVRSASGSSLPPARLGP
jgi:uncharacterized protein